jgi:hypothetical protein
VVAVAVWVILYSAGREQSEEIVSVCEGGNCSYRQVVEVGSVQGPAKCRRQQRSGEVLVLLTDSPRSRRYI